MGSQSQIFRLTGRTDSSDRQNRLVLDRSQIESHQKNVKFRSSSFLKTKET